MTQDAANGTRNRRETVDGGHQSTEDVATSRSSMAATSSTSSQRSLMSARVEKSNSPPSKVVIRRLPPSMTLDSFVDQISPVPENDYLHFVRADMSLGQFAFSRAYINFCNRNDIFLFKDKFDGYVFVDSKGAEYSAVVEFAPFPKVPKKKPKKIDAKCGTIEQDPDYLKFLENLKNPEEVNLPSAEFYLEEIENRERELRANSGSRNLTTPLIEYLREKKAEKVRVREERREERRRREAEKKRQKEDDRRRKKADRERERERNNARERTSTRGDGKQLAGEKTKLAEPAAVKLLKNPERERPKERIENEAPSFQKSNLDKDAVAVDTMTSPLNKPSRPDQGGLGGKQQRMAPAVVKDWSAEVDRERGSRSRREEVRSRDNKQREFRGRPRRADQTAMRPDEDQQQQSSVSRAKSSSHEGATIKTTPSSGASGPGSRSATTTEWHRGGAQRTIAAASGGGGARTPASQGKGKSYEKSRQEALASAAKARSGKSGAAHPTSTKANDDDQKVHQVNELQQGVQRESNDVKMADRCDAEVVESTSYRRERSSRDPRTERRIRNKDRPSLELYRPGMRRMSQQWSSGAQKDQSSSSSPSPTTVDPADHGRDYDDGSSHHLDKNQEDGDFLPRAMEGHQE